MRLRPCLNAVSIHHGPGPAAQRSHKGVGTMPDRAARGVGPEAVQPPDARRRRHEEGGRREPVRTGRASRTRGAEAGHRAQGSRGTPTNGPLH